MRLFEHYAVEEQAVYIGACQALQNPKFLTWQERHLLERLRMESFFRTLTQDEINQAIEVLNALDAMKG